ncbi:hypothetical protein K431DRAFT_247665 [Polychaeton citri CBS 116435]|uniref:Integral membrane protein n=1 Tax=Polychaeton citri CBS 116435 TaxID=1314669 RepID=A0A9P4Q812_9PEZI|nr:hypothetical protein K431DRAFT_247665 [Polychaeton citri CBS 116435]
MAGATDENGVKSTRFIVPFLVAMMLLTGVCNTLLTKYQDMQCVRDCDTSKPKTFEQPVAQTLQMFVGESGCWLVVLVGNIYSRVRGAVKAKTSQEPEYERVQQEDSDTEDADGDEEAGQGMSSSQTLVDATNVIAKPLIDGSQTLEPGRTPLQGWRITLLALPAICDICGTTLMNVGLLFVAASIYQMTRGALVLFVGLFSVLFLKRHLGIWKWASLVIVVLGVAVVGLAGALENRKIKHPLPLPGHTVPHDNGVDSHDRDLFMYAKFVIRGTVKALEEHSAAETVLGVFLIAVAQVFTATQFVAEESIMEKYSMDPIQVVGWEGVFGFVVTFVGMWILHAAIGSTPEGKYGYFDAREGLYEVFNNPAVGISSLLIMISIGGFNFFGLSVTRTISATSRSTIDTCRTLFIWIVSLGLGWESFKWLQVVGFALLVYGTGLFNDIIPAPTKMRAARRRASGSRPRSSE